MKITPEIAERINELYVEIGVKKKVAEIIGCSPSTVSKYIIPNFIPKTQRPAYTFEGTIGNSEWMISLLEMIDNPAQKLCELCMLKDEEWDEMRELQKEIYL